MPRKTSPFVAQAVAEYIALREHQFAPSTLSNTRSVLQKFTDGVGNPQLHRLTPQLMERFMAEWGQTLAPSSFNQVRSTIVGFLAFATRRGWVDSDPMQEVRPRKVPQRERLRLGRTQLVQLLAATENPRDRATLAIGIHTALRASDISNLRVRDLDLDGGWIQTRIQKTAGEDSIPVTRELDRELRSWLTVYASELANIGMALQPDHILVPALRSGKKRGQRFGSPRPSDKQKRMEDVAKRALRRIGIRDVRLEGMHTLRRSAARLVFERASEAGHDGALRLVAALLNHRDVATTQNYIGVSGDRLKRDQLLRGRSFLEMDERSNVIPLERAGND